MQDDSVCKGDQHGAALAMSPRAARMAKVTDTQLSRCLGAIALNSRFLSDQATDELWEAAKRLRENDSQA